MSSLATPSLTDEQLKVADEGPEAKLMVTAGPGTGKTYTLIARLLHLTQKHGLGAAREILVLSFSRAAVREIRDRCRKLGGDLSFVYVTTFDSYATRLLSEEQPGGDWVGRDYDGRIEAATYVLKSEPRVAEHHLQFRHILVDEIQDLVGVRAEFVQAILALSPAGFSVFGDPAQGIYNFQLTGADRQIGSSKLYTWFSHQFPKQLKTYSLSTNQRATTRAALVAYTLGPKLRHEGADWNFLYEDLREIVTNLPDEGKYEDLPKKRICAPGLSAAILCRNNGQALMISRRFWENEVPHILRRGASERFLPYWIHFVMSAAGGPFLNKELFHEVLSAIAVSDEVIDTWWRLLKRAEGRSGKRIDVEQVNRAFRIGLIPDELHENLADPITISTIHRAKGLEFDNVLLAVPPDSAADPEYVDEEARTLFVALTRARQYLATVELPALRGLQQDKRGDRWFRGFDKWKTNDFELKPEDIFKSEPPNGVSRSCLNAKEVQEYLVQYVDWGDPVTLELAEPCTDTTAVYELMHDGTAIGRTTDEFRSIFLSLLRGRYRSANLPVRIEGLRVEGLETVFGDPQISIAEQLTASGTWLSARIGGLGTLRYS